MSPNGIFNVIWMRLNLMIAKMKVQVGEECGFMQFLK